MNNIDNKKYQNTYRFYIRFKVFMTKILYKKYKKYKKNNNQTYYIHYYKKYQKQIYNFSNNSSNLMQIYFHITKMYYMINYLIRR